MRNEQNELDLFEIFKKSSTNQMAQSKIHYMINCLSFSLGLYSKYLIITAALPIKVLYF